MSNTKQGHVVYGHAQFTDVQIAAVKSLYAQYIQTGRTHKAAVHRVVDTTGNNYHDVCSMVAKKKIADLKSSFNQEIKSMSTKELVHECYREMVKINRPGTAQHHLIMDVCDRMLMDYAEVTKLINEEVLIQLTLF